MSNLKAIHYDGGNYFNEIKINLPESYRAQDQWIKTVSRNAVNRPLIINYLKLFAMAVFKKLGLHDAMIVTGIQSKWHAEFLDYWSNVLEGRPLTVFDFHQLHFQYRLKNQEGEELSWNSPAEHLANWQTPENIGLLFHYVRKYAFSPFTSRNLFKYLKKNMRVLEYGCSLAPMYRIYRDYLSHRRSSWVLADIPNFPFHYSRYTYAKDRDVQLAVIEEDRFDDPLKDAPGDFDIIIIQEVFEHLDKPLWIAKYLLERLKPGGLFFFDYAVSDAKGLDTHAGLSERKETLEYLRGNLEFIGGNFQISEQTLGVCVGRKTR
jgi:SAM-dependent methyltransferase